jgi:hypothetical protein
MSHSNKDRKPLAESEEGRPSIKENAGQPHTYSAQSGKSVPQGAGRTRSPLGLPVLPLVSYAYMQSPLPGQVQRSLFARLSPLPAAFPLIKQGRLLQLFFRGLLGVHSRYGLHARGVAKRPFTPRAPTALLPPLPPRLLPGRANQFPGGSFSR